MSINAWFASFLLLAVLCQLHKNNSMAKCGFFIVPEFHVDITNNIINGARIHCKSKQDDLGIHSLAYGQTYTFSFRPQVFGKTLFFCAVMWNGKLEWFDAYIHKRDYQRCIHSECHCPWKLTPQGPCFADNCVPWNNKNFHQGEQSSKLLKD
uniref:S-protein homolog n=1 Tax=Kalanchoe fedtschenkoi TaxID=63787 RepID=A0A7N0U506_KALFE